MKIPITVMLATTMLAAVALAETFNFHNLKVGAPPPGWTCTKTGTGEEKWTIEQDDYPPNNWNVLKQSGQATYPICILDSPSIQDGFVEVKFKQLSGKQDQAAGLIWRVKDSNNYNIVRANALENDVTAFQTINGRRTMKVRRYLPVIANVWHTLRVDFKGNNSAVTYDGTQVFIWVDETLKESGKVGVWTKADSVTMFDGFTYGTQ